MGLEDIAKSLKEGYSDETLLSAIDYMNKLAEADLDTSKGLKSYQEITGDKEKSEEIIKQRKKDFQGALQGELEKWTSNNIFPLSKKLNENSAIEIGLKYLPENLKVNSEYDAAIKNAQKSKKILNEIKKNPDSYFANSIETFGSWAQSVLEKNKDIYLNHFQEEAAENMGLAVHSYGPQKFVAETMTALKNHSEEYQSKNMGLQRKLGEKLAQEKSLKGRVLTAKESAGIKKPYFAQLGKLAEDYQDVQNYKPMMENFIMESYSTLKSKEKKK